MPKGYVILTEAIHDPQGMAAYAGAARGPIHDHNGKVLVADQAPTVLEGEWHGNQTVIVEFESVAAAQAWYESPEYQTAVALRQGAAHTNAVIVAGFERPARAS
jgi:uncharacterized protein (DUF1330 family)